jgi:hypothetical protein
VLIVRLPESIASGYVEPFSGQIWGQFQASVVVARLNLLGGVYKP